MKMHALGIGHRLALTFSAIAVLTLLLGFTGYYTLYGIEGRWQVFQETSLRKDAAVTDARVALGDAIQSFKNYVLRGQDYDKRFSKELESINTNLANYEKISVPNDAEKAALAQARQGVQVYQAAIVKAVEMKSGGAGIEDIDKAINGADRPIKQALAELDKVVSAETTNLSGAIAKYVKQGELAVAIMVALSLGLSLLLAWRLTLSITRPLNEAVTVAETVDAGDLTSRIEVRSNDETGKLLKALKHMNESLRCIVGDVRAGTELIASASSQIAEGSKDLSARTEQGASALEQTSASMLELTDKVKLNAAHASQAHQLATSASDVATKGGAVVIEVVHTMDAIHASSRKIADITSVIDGIAFQTNILALNAAVEAARAGEQGRGFAVVASEVRTLAQRSAAAAKEIKVLIGDSVERVEAGSRLVNEAGSTMEEIVQSVRRVTDIMSEITVASEDQSNGIEQINQAVAEMDRVMQQNASLVEETANAAYSLQEQAASLKQVVGTFKTESVPA